MLTQLSERGASFWQDLVAAAHRSGGRYEDPEVLEALWDLVWAGLVTNDSLAPLRALAERTSAQRGGSGGARSGRGRPRLGRLARIGPPAGAGRWSLVGPLVSPAPSPTEAATARALQLLERYGVLTREAALGEGAEGGFAGVYPVLRALEERGQVRRGYFVAGLGAAQFALPGAVDRLRERRDPAEDGEADVLVLAATDPAQPYGASLPWPATGEDRAGGRLARAAGAHVVLADGELVAYLERSGRRLTTFPAAQAVPGWPAALGQLVRRRRLRQLEIATIDGEAATSSPTAPLLRDAGFREGYKGLVLRGEP
jgi:ATP-dependent Lhr-like helicase